MSFYLVSLHKYKEYRGFLRYNPVFLFGFLAAAPVEVPPFTGQSAETCGTHNGAQQLAVLLFLFRHFSALHQGGFVRDMGFGTQMVYFRAHRQRDSRFIQYADVYCQTVVMQSAATCRVGDVDIFG